MARKQPKPDFTSLAEFNATRAASRERAMQAFERDWGTRDVKKVYGALAASIPGSSSPADAAQKALAIVRG